MDQHDGKKRPNRRQVLGGTAATIASTLVFGRPAAAQEKYPARPIRVMVGTPAGGSFDLIMRPLANSLSARIGQPVVLEHRPGANQVIAVTAVAKAPPDGYLIGMASDAPLSLAPALPAPLPFHPSELTPIAVIQHVSLMLVTHTDNPIKSVADLVARAKAAPGRVSYASLGVGSIAHVAMEAFAVENGIELLHVPYAGTNPAVTATVARDVDMTFVSIGVTLPHIPGRLRPIALAGPIRSPMLPNVPTFIESGHKDFEVRAWFGLVAPRRTPEAIVSLLRQEVWKIVSSDEFIRTAVLPTAAERSTVPPENLENFLRADLAKWERWVKRLGPNVKLS